VKTLLEIRSATGYPHLPYGETIIERTKGKNRPLFCNVETGSVIEGRDVQSIYEVPLMYEREGLPGIGSREIKS